MTGNRNTMETKNGYMQTYQF